MNLFGQKKITVSEAQELTVQSINAYGPDHDHWCIAWSGGKDSTCMMTLILYLIQSGQVNPPKKLTVLYADTRMELPPLAIGAKAMMKRIKEISNSGSFPCDLHIESVMAPLDKRYFVYMLGRGVPPPNNNTLRWCTPALKVVPMQERVEREFYELNPQLQGVDRKCWPEDAHRPLMITGVRVGESAIRDGRIAMSCSKNGAECGQGWYQHTIPGTITATLAPITHWRVCTVWDWLKVFAPMPAFGGWHTQMLAEAYGGDMATEVNARTGCIGCPLANHDTALDALISQYPLEWGYLAPIRRLRPLYRELREARHRHRKHGETLSDGRPSSSPYRMGPLTMEARAYGLQQVLSVQDEINTAADGEGRPHIDILNPEETDRIRWHWSEGIYPKRWSANDPLATEPYLKIEADGSFQGHLFGLKESV